MKRIAHKQNEMGMYSAGVMEGWSSCFKKEKKTFNFKVQCTSLESDCMPQDHPVAAS